MGKIQRVEARRRPLPLAIEDTDGTTDVEQWSELLGRVKNAKEAVASWEAALKQKILGWVRENGPLIVGDIKYYEGFPSETKSGDPAAILEVLIIHTQGDVGAISAFLASQPFKHGACKNALPPAVYEKLFITTRGSRLVNGKPTQKELLALNTKHLEGK